MCTIVPLVSSSLSPPLSNPLPSPPLSIPLPSPPSSSHLDCDTIKKWMNKCQDDSETANYIIANTKDVSHDWLID